MKGIRRVLLMIIAWVGLISCQENEIIDQPVLDLVPPGVFVVNEGNFTFGNASLTYYQSDKKTLTPDVFYTANGVPLGDVANFMVIDQRDAYIVVNNSGVIYNMDVQTGIYKGKVSGLTSPRELLLLGDGKGLVSDLTASSLTVIDLDKFAVIDKIPLDKRTSESMVKVENKVYVCNWSGMYQEKKNDQVLVVDLETWNLTDSIRVTLEPNSMVVDHQGFVWVLCGGGYMSETFPALYKIDVSGDTIVTKYEFPDKQSTPTDLCVNGDGNRLYFLNKNVYSMSINDGELSQEALIEAGDRRFYSLGVDPFSGDLYVSDAIDYMQKGDVMIFDSAGTPKNSFKAGIIPGFFAFFE